MGADHQVKKEGQGCAHNRSATLGIPVGEGVKNRNEGLRENHQ